MKVRIVIFLICFSAYLSAAALAPPTGPEAGPRYPETSVREEPARRVLVRRNVWVSEYELN